MVMLAVDIKALSCGALRDADLVGQARVGIAIDLGLGVGDHIQQRLGDGQVPTAKGNASPWNPQSNTKGSALVIPLLPPRAREPWRSDSGRITQLAAGAEVSSWRSDSGRITQSAAPW